MTKQWKGKTNSLIFINLCRQKFYTITVLARDGERRPKWVWVPTSSELRGSRPSSAAAVWNCNRLPVFAEHWQALHKQAADEQREAHSRSASVGRLPAIPPPANKQSTGHLPPPSRPIRSSQLEQKRFCFLDGNSGVSTLWLRDEARTIHSVLIQRVYLTAIYSSPLHLHALITSL